MKNKLSLMQYVSELWELANKKQIGQFSFIYDGEQYMSFWNPTLNQWSNPNKIPQLLELDIK